MKVISFPCVVLAFLVLIMMAPAANPQGKLDPFFTGAPFSLNDVLQSIGNIADKRLTLAILHRGVDFMPTSADLDRLKKAGASQDLLDAITTSAPMPKKTPEETGSAKKSVQPVRAKPASEGTFLLEATPEGSEAVFNGGARCFTPCTMTLPTGRNVFVIRHAGYRDEQRIIEVPRDTRLEVKLVPAIGTLSLISNPPGMTITVDGKDQPNKTPAILTLATGPHQVQVALGSIRQQFKVEILDGVVTEKTVGLSQ
jgi:hypothetical protein